MMHNFFTSLQIMWRGMLGLFVVAILIMLVTMFLVKVIKPR
jgi:hypothetical protein